MATTKEIHFHNKTNLPVMIDSWIEDSNMLYTRTIEPNEKCILHSSVGEWHIHSMFTEKENQKKWNDSGMGHIRVIGKFRSKSDKWRDSYSWMETEEFECKYSVLENMEINGMIEFIRNTYKKEEIEINNNTSTAVAEGAMDVDDENETKDAKFSEE